jgi:hypothetical protein
VGAVPTGLVRTDLGDAKRQLERAAKQHPRLANLETSLKQFEADAGPTGWIDWLLAMRNMLVHRGRRIVSWNIVRGEHDNIEGFVINLPRSPELTEVDAWVQAGGYVASEFQVSHAAFLDALFESVQTYLNVPRASFIHSGRSGKLILVFSNSQRLSGSSHKGSSSPRCLQDTHLPRRHRCQSQRSA